MLDAKVLGQLLIMQNILVNLPDEKSIFNFVCRGLSDLPGIADVRYSKTPQEKKEALSARFPFLLGESYRGELLLTVADQTAFSPYEDYLKNFCFMVAVILEERQQRRQIEEHHIELERRIQERTRQLTTQIEERQLIEKSLRESEARFRMIFEQAAVGMQVVSPEGKWLQVNQRLCQILGYPYEELITMDFRIITHPNHLEHDVERVRQMVAGIRDSDSWEKRYIRKDGKETWARITTALTRDENGLPKYFITVTQDISGQKEAEAEIQRLNAELEQRVRERTAQLEAANRELEGFSYSVSHDLRAPLRHLTGFVNLLEKHKPKELDEKSRHYLKVISDSAVKMGRLIDDILSFSRLGRAELRRRRINMDGLVKEARDLIRQDLQEREILWKVDVLPEVNADPEMLKMVVTNLIANAVKFTRQKDRGVIEIGCLDDQPDEDIFYFKDNGSGFDMRYEDKLFGLFQRLHHEKDFEGTGLGLANVRRIIARHGGRTWAEGKVGEGATFYFSLPKEIG